MDLIEKATVQAFHRNRLGGTPLKALGFRELKSQTHRFDSLCRWGDFSNCSVLDLGCGYGDLKLFLDQRFTNFIYLGIDFLQEFIDEAQTRHGHLTHTQFFQADFLTAGLPEVDIVVASGSLNYRSNNVLHPWQAISRMWETCQRGIAFNLLDAKHFVADDILCGYDIQETLAYCQKLDPNTEIIQGYLVDDFTVLMRKT
jgi:SAM-dependent methyltransferase